METETKDKSAEVGVRRAAGAAQKEAAQVKKVVNSVQKPSPKVRPRGK